MAAAHTNGHAHNTYWLQERLINPKSYYGPNTVCRRVQPNSAAGTAAPRWSPWKIAAKGAKEPHSHRMIHKWMRTRVVGVVARRYECTLKSLHRHVHLIILFAGYFSVALFCRHCRPLSTVCEHGKPGAAHESKRQMTKQALCQMIGLFCEALHSTER